MQLIERYCIYRRQFTYEIRVFAVQFWVLTDPHPMYPLNIYKCDFKLSRKRNCLVLIYTDNVLYHVVKDNWKADLRAIPMWFPENDIKIGNILSKQKVEFPHRFPSGNNTLPIVLIAPASEVCRINAVHLQSASLFFCVPCLRLRLYYFLYPLSQLFPLSHPYHGDSLISLLFKIVLVFWHTFFTVHYSDSTWYLHCEGWGVVLPVWPSSKAHKEEKKQT